MAHRTKTADEDPNPKGVAAGFWGAFTDIVLVFLVLLVVGGDRAPGVNEAHYVTRLKQFWDPDWVRDDLFLDSPDAHLTVVVLLGWATWWLPLPAVAWLGRLLTWGLLAWAWRRLSWRVAPRWGLAALTAAVWCVGVRQGHFAGEWAVGGFEAKGLAYAGVLAALGSLIRDQWNQAWVCLGLATAMHVLVGGWSIVLFALIWLADRRRRPPLRAMAPGLAVGAAVGLAGVLPPLIMNAGASPDDAAEAARVYVFERLPHHLAPLSKGAAWLAARGGPHLLVLGALAGAAAWARRSGRQDVAQLCRYAGGALLLAAIGLAIEFALQQQPERAAGLLRYYWFRTNDVAAPMAAALGLGAWLSTATAKRRTAARMALLASILIAVCCLGGTAADRLLDKRPPADRAVYDHQAWRDACRWARRNTAPDARFLTPRRAHTFHWWAERAEVVVHKNVPQDAAGILEWRRRMWRVHRRPGAGRNPRFGWALTPGALGARRLRRLAEAYGFDYVLSDRRRPASLPIAYRNRSYVIYDLRGAGQRPASPAAANP